MFTVVAIVVLLLFSAVIKRCSRSDAESGDTDSLATEKVDTATVAKELAVSDSVAPVTILPRVASPALEFNDTNCVHLNYARTIGISPLRHTSDIMEISRPIVEVTENDNISIPILTHSYPYLVPAAARLVNEIGESFSRHVAATDPQQRHYRIMVTSMLRTQPDVENLQKGNRNAASNSAHLYGTTFDISYVKFAQERGDTTKVPEAMLKDVLTGVIKEFRDQGRCAVKYERKQSCYHITATGK